MRYFFHLHNDIEAYDEEGRELPDIEAARDAAMAAARDMAAESVREGHLNLGHYVEVEDGHGTPVMKITFGEVVSILPS
jgi:hypothetical protein